VTLAIKKSIVFHVNPTSACSLRRQNYSSWKVLYVAMRYLCFLLSVIVVTVTTVTAAKITNEWMIYLQ